MVMGSEDLTEGSSSVIAAAAVSSVGAGSMGSERTSCL
jgi:hypothetical protein